MSASKISNKDLQFLAAMPSSEDARVWINMSKKVRAEDLERRKLLDLDLDDGLLYGRRTSLGDEVVKLAQAEDGR